MSNFTDFLIDTFYRNKSKMLLTQSKLSSKELAWCALIFLAIAFTALEATFSFTFHTNLQIWQVWSDVVISVIFIADTVYNFRQRRKTIPGEFGEVESNIKWYITMGIDVFACIPFDLIAYSMNLAGTFEFFAIARILRLSRIFKFIKILTLLDAYSKIIRYSTMFILSLVGVHWIACGWVLIYPTEAKDITTYYIKSLYWATATLTTIGYGDITPTTNGGRLYTMVIMILGVGVYGVVIANVARAFQQADRYKEKSKQKLNDLHNFMKYYNIPDRVQQNAYSYLQHIVNKRLTDNDSNIISDLPHALQHELQIFMKMKFISNVAVFKKCSLSCLKAVASKLEQVYYSPGQTVIQVGEQGDEMYIIGHGSVEVILKDGNIVASLHEGQFFGEAALLKEIIRNANIRAQNYCDLYKLKKADFLEIIESHPELLEKLEVVTFKRSSDRRKTSSPRAMPNFTDQKADGRK